MLRPLKHVMPHPWGTNDGMAQLGTSGLQKGEILKLLSVLPLRHLSVPMLCHKLALKEGNLLDKAFSILTCRG
jgi:hypothetical protein